MEYNGDGIEAVRFGARLGRVGIGCCGLDLIQGFSHSPDDTTTFPLRYGDEDTPIFGYADEGDSGDGQKAFVGTNLQVLKALLTLGTHDDEPKRARSFLVTLSHDQVSDEEGRRWLAILAELGFEYIRSFENGVYGSGSLVHLFGYFRNYDEGVSFDKPPRGWEELPKGKPTYVEEDFHSCLKTIGEDE